MADTGMKLSKRTGLGTNQIKNKQNHEVYKEFSSENGQSPLCFLLGGICSPSVILETNLRGRRILLNRVIKNHWGLPLCYATAALP